MNGMTQSQACFAGKLNTVAHTGVVHPQCYITTTTLINTGQTKHQDQIKLFDKNANKSTFVKLLQKIA